MKKYIGSKILKAKPMTRGEYNRYRGWELPANEDPADDGYLVEYIDGGKPNDSRHEGYISWSPADIFEKAYFLVDDQKNYGKLQTRIKEIIDFIFFQKKGGENTTNAGLTFGQAIEALKAGRRVARKGWNGKGMFLWLKPAAIIKSEWCKDPLLKKLAEDNGGEIQALGTICMFTHDSTGRKAVLTGWLASQSDMLLEDWEIVEEKGTKTK